MIYAECIPTANESSISNTAAAYSCKRLGLPPVVLRFFQESAGEPIKKGYLKGKPFEAEDSICGFSSWLLLKDTQTVWIRSGMTDKELVITVAHELYHFYENSKYWPTDEQKAEAFGRQVYAELTDWARTYY